MKKLRNNEFDDELRGTKQNRKDKRLRAALKKKDIDALDDYEDWY